MEKQKISIRRRFRCPAVGQTHCIVLKQILLFFFLFFSCNHYFLCIINNFFFFFDRLKLMSFLVVQWLRVYVSRI